MNLLRRGLLRRTIANSGLRVTQIDIMDGVSVPIDKNRRQLSFQKNIKFGTDYQIWIEIFSRLNGK